MGVVEKQVPPLIPGQRLTREEFMRRWEAMPSVKRAELINGVVYMPSPVSTDHGDCDSDVNGWLFTYATHTPGTKSSTSTTTFMLEDAPQPDAHLRLLPEVGGLARRFGKYLKGALELAAEVSRSSGDYDLYDKLDLYEKAGVLEYIVILLDAQEIRWFHRQGKTLKMLPVPADGIWRSRTFPGLWLDGPAFLAGNMAQVLATLQRGLQTPEHAAFVRELAARRKSRNGSKVRRKRRGGSS